MWKTYADWPIPGTQMIDVFLQEQPAAAGTLGGIVGRHATPRRCSATTT